MKFRILFKNIFLSLLFLAIIPGLVTASENSGFLDDYSKLAPDPEQPGAKIYRKEGANLASYTRVMIVPNVLCVR